MAVLLGMGVVAGTAWLVFAPVTYEGPDGTVTCHSPTTANKQKVGYDGACHTPAVQRRWLVFGPLVLVGAASLVGLIAPGLRRRDDEPDDEADDEASDAVGDESAESPPRPTSTATPIGETDQSA